MEEENVPKTIFYTHNGDYKVLIMPFGLCNVPSTFHSLMNKIFQHFLYHYVLVFFNDLLVYNPTWENHLQRVALTFQLLQEH